MINSIKSLGPKPACVSRRPKDAEWLAGYRDAYFRLPYRPDYERWRPRAQRQYENGRLICTNIRSSGVAVPKPTFITHSPTFVAAYHATKDRVGIAHDVQWSTPDCNMAFEETVQIY